MCHDPIQVSSFIADASLCGILTTSLFNQQRLPAESARLLQCHLGIATSHVSPSET